MKVDNPSFDKEALIPLLRAAYALDVTRLEFVPKGEESYSYLATTNTGQRYFVKVHLASISPALEACYRFVHHLGTYEGCEWVVAPCLTVEGNCLATLGEHPVVVFDYVPGITKAPGELAGAQMESFAGQLAQLHNADASALAAGLPKETFAISFREWLLEVLEAVDQPLRTGSAWSQAAYDLVRAEKSNVLSMLATIEEIGPLLQAADIPLAVTHGDLASHNMIEDEHGRLLVVDWGKLCIAPAARDLVALWENGDEALLAAYFHQVDGSSVPTKQMLTYYFYYYLLAMVTDYGSWLILEDVPPEEAENAWVGLQQALPLDLQGVHTKVETIYQLALNISKASGAA